MKLTPSRIETIIRRHEQLTDLADSYVRHLDAGGRSGEVRISNGAIEEHVNTACHCHPEYEWVHRASLEDFAAWVATRD